MTLKQVIMDYQDFSGEAISKQDMEFAKEFENFVNGRMRSADDTGRELSRAHRYLQQQMSKVFIGFIRQLAHNYRRGIMTTATSGHHVWRQKHTARLSKRSLSMTPTIKKQK